MMKRLMTYAILSLTLSVVTSAAMDDGELNITNIDWNTLKVEARELSGDLEMRHAGISEQ